MIKHSPFGNQTVSRVETKELDTLLVENLRKLNSWRSNSNCKFTSLEEPEAIYIEGYRWHEYGIRHCGQSGYSAYKAHHMCTFVLRTCTAQTDSCSTSELHPRLVAWYAPQQTVGNECATTYLCIGSTVKSWSLCLFAWSSFWLLMHFATINWSLAAIHVELSQRGSCASWQFRCILSCTCNPRILGVEVP